MHTLNGEIMQLKDYQKNAIANWKTKPNIFFEERTGKTAVGLEIALQFEPKNIVFVLSNNAVQTWIESTKLERYKSLQNSIFCVSSHFSRDITFNKYIKNRLPAKIDLLVVDEADMYKNFASKRTKTLLKLSRQAAHVIALTATPTSRDEDIDPIYTLLSITKSLPLVKNKPITLNHWHNKWCEQTVKFLSSQRRIFDYKLKKDKKVEFYQFIDSVCSKAELEKHGGKKATIIPYYFDYTSNLGQNLSKNALKQLNFTAIRSMTADMLAQSGIINLAVDTKLKNKDILTGHIDKIHVTKETNKIDELAKLLSTLDKRKPTFICYNYIEERNQILKLLKLSKVLTIKDKNDMSFLDNHYYFNYIIGHVSTLARGLELADKTNNLIIYSISHDFATFKQLESRLNTIKDYNNYSGKIYYLLGTEFSRELYSRLQTKKDHLLNITKEIN